MCLGTTLKTCDLRRKQLLFEVYDVFMFRKVYRFMSVSIIRYFQDLSQEPKWHDARNSKTLGCQG